MAVATSNVLDGLFSHLTGDSTFNTAVGGTASSAGRIRYGLADQEETAPYVGFDLIDDTFAGTETFAKQGFHMRVQFRIYGGPHTDPSDLMDVEDKLRARLHRASPFSVTGHTVTGSVRDQMRGPFREEDVWRIDADYMIDGFEN